MRVKNTILVLFFSLIVISLIISFFQDRNKDILLENKSKTFGILVYSYHATAVRSISYGIFVFRIKKKRVKLKICGDYSKLKLGDTVLMEYAKKDPSVARVVDKYYMKKHKYLKD